jgi:glycosyltransferase involved in cell wall biosynthesis
MAMHQHYQISPDKLIVCPNGVDTVFFDVTYKKSEAREKLELPIKAFIIGCAGRVETAGQSKGVNILMQAFELAQSTIPNAHLCIVGDTKSVPHWQIPLYLRSFDIAVLPLGTGSLSRTTAPIKLFEYLAAGCAIVAADASSLKEYLDDTTAVFFDPTDPENLALVLQDLSQDDQRRARLGEAARAKSELHTWNSRAKNILTLINE